MDIFEAILTRRSLRKFTGQPLKDKEIEKILQCAMHAPSAVNEQPWQFIVVKSQNIREQLSATSPYTHMARQASVVIVVCGDLSLEKAPGFWVQDCSAAIQNILLAACGLNIGAVWCGVYPEKERIEFIKKTLALPENVIPLGMINLGYSEQKYHEEDRFKPERIHLDKW